MLVFGLSLLFCVTPLFWLYNRVADKRVVDRIHELMEEGTRDAQIPGWEDEDYTKQISAEGGSRSAGEGGGGESPKA